MKREDLTVVVVARNARATIARALDSAVKAGAANILVVDDASEDGTPEVVRSYTGRDTFLIPKPEHTTLGSARQLAIDSVRTPIWMGLDSDDEFHPERIDECLRAFEKGAQLFIDGAEVVRSDLDGTRSMFAPIPGFLREHGLFRLFERNHLPVTGPIAVDTQLSRAVGYDSDFVTAEDFDFLLRLARRNPVVALDSRCLYRIHKQVGSRSSDIGVQNTYVRRALEKHSYSEVRQGLEDRELPRKIVCWCLCSMSMYRGDWGSAKIFLEEAWSGVDNAQRDGLGEWVFCFTYGTILLELGEIEKAQAALALANEELQRPEGMNNLGVVFALKGELQMANRFFENALSMVPDYFDARQNLSGALPWRVTHQALRAGGLKRPY